MRELVITEILTIANPGWQETSDGRWDPDRYDNAYEYAYKIKNGIYILNSLTKAQKKEAGKLVLNRKFFEGFADSAVLNIYKRFHTRFNQQR